MNIEDLRAILPRHKSDFENVEKIRQIGFPEVAPIMPDILEWVQDINWPIAGEIAKFVASIGADAAVYVRPILLGSDEIWTRWVLGQIVRHSRSLALEFRPVIERFANNPTEGECEEETDRVAREILEDLSDVVDAGNTPKDDKD